MARSWISGAESGSISETATPGTGCTVQSSVVRTGAYAFSCTSTNAFFDAPTYTASTMIYSAYLRITAAPGADNTFMQVLSSSTGVATLIMTSSRTIKIMRGASGGTLLGTTTTAISTGTWYLVELKVVGGTSRNGTIELKVWDDDWTNGPTLLETKTYTSQTLASTTVSGCGFGFRTTAQTIYWDDIVTEASSTYPGPHKVIARQPVTGTPTYNSWTTSGSDPYWADTPFDTTNYLTSTNGASVKQTKLIADFDATQSGHGSETIDSNDTINGATVRYVARKSATQTNATYAWLYRIGGSDTQSSTVTLTTSDVFYDGPQIGSQTLSDLNGMEAGGVQVTTGTSLMRIRDLWVMVDYTPVTGNVEPTISPDTEDSAYFTTTTPALEFTGSDTDSDPLRYNIQIDTANTFNNSTQSADTKIVRPSSFTDTAGDWTNESNAYDGSTLTYTNNSTDKNPGDLLLNGFSHGLASNEDIFAVKLVVKISGSGISDDYGELGIRVSSSDNSVFNFWDNSGGHGSPVTYVAEVVANPNATDGIWTKTDFNNMAVHYSTQLANSQDTIDVRIYDVYAEVTYYNTTNTGIFSAYSTSSLDGDVHDTDADGDGDTVDASSSNGWVGIDYAGGVKQEYRWFTSFDISSLSGSATILDAQVQLTQDLCYREGQATNPGPRWPNISGKLVVDHINYGASLTTAAFDQSALTSAIATVGEANRAADGTGLENNIRVIGFRSGVASAVGADRTATRTRTQFRLRFDAGISTASNSDNYIAWLTANYSTGTPEQYHPRLRVLYGTSGGVPLIDKVSGTDDGFANTADGGDSDPFTAGDKVSFTVQSGDALGAGTYYWHAKCMDPDGTATYSGWTTTRSFTVELPGSLRHPKVKPRLPQINWSHPISRGLVFDMPFIEGGGTLVKETTAKQNGTSSSLTDNTWQPDHYGRYMSFSEAGLVSGKSGAQMNGLNNLTIEMYTRCNGGTNGGIVFSKSTPSSNPPFWYLRQDVDTNSWAFCGGWPNDPGWGSSWGSLGVDVWRHVVITMANMASTSSEPDFYIDTEPANDYTFAVAPTGTRLTDDNTYAVGGALDNSGYYDGDVAYIRVWKRPLTYQEIVTLYNKPWIIYKEPGFYQSLDMLAALVPRYAGINFQNPGIL